MNESSKKLLDRCLAYVVIESYDTWLGSPSPGHLSAFLNGAASRAGLVKSSLPTWMIFGPLERPDFYLPLVARTGHPDLSIKWATALEIHHFSLLDAMRELRHLVERWTEDHGTDATDERAVDWGDPGGGLRELLKSLARRPAMYLGGHSGWALRCFLSGMDRGGDWLSLPPLADLREVVDSIEESSRRAYGSSFAAYRVYEQSPQEILAWAGIEAGS